MYICIYFYTYNRHIHTHIYVYIYICIYVLLLLLLFFFFFSHLQEKALLQEVLSLEQSRGGLAFLLGGLGFRASGL